MTPTPNQLYCQPYDSAWVAGTGFPINIPCTTNPALSCVNVCYDPDASGREVVLVFYNFMISQTYVFFLPASGFGASSLP